MDWNHFTDVILAGVIVVTCIILISYGHDGEIKAVLGAGVVYLFGKAGLQAARGKSNGSKGGNHGAQG